jgi:hypothetical protein
LISKLLAQIKIWKYASISLPIIAVISLVISDLIFHDKHDQLIACILIGFSGVSIMFWIWTVWQMMSLVNYLSNIENNYLNVVKELQETKKLLRGSSIRQRRSHSRSKVK